MKTETKQIKVPAGVVCHKTEKTSKGFSYTVWVFAYQKPTVILKFVDGYRSRGIATSRAKARKMYFKKCQELDLLASL